LACACGKISPHRVLKRNKQFKCQHLPSMQIV
jgi:hypothetical protein